MLQGLQAPASVDWYHRWLIKTNYSGASAPILQATLHSSSRQPGALFSPSGTD
jgi:hypothetical protein